MRALDKAELYYSINERTRCAKTGQVFTIRSIRRDPDQLNSVLGSAPGAAVKRYLYYRNDWAGRHRKGRRASTLTRCNKAMNFE